MEKQTLSFYTTGEGFTNLMNSFFEEGRFKALYETLSEGGLPEDQIVEFFYGRGYFEGDSRNAEGLSYLTRKVDLPQNERFYWAMANFITNIKEKKTHHVPEYYDDHSGVTHEAFDYTSHYKYESVLEALHPKAWEECEDLQYLHKIITRDSLIELIWKKVLQKEGWQLNPKPGPDCPRGAVILRTGDVVVCEYMDHVNLYPILYALNLASSSDWIDDRWTMHVSSGQVGGSVAHALTKEYGLDGAYPTLAQIQTLIKYKKVFEKIYGEWDSLMESIRVYYGILQDYGGKYNNLFFLKTCYPKIKIPEFSKEPLVHKKYCIRTSPKYSLPGLLESKFDFDENAIQPARVIQEMNDTFEKYKNVREENEFHWFFQEYIDGLNGVCHRTKDGFSYALGKEQGDVVKGKKSNLKLSIPAEKNLRKIADELFSDLKISLQLEFVVTESGEVYIVQLRKLDNDPDRTAYVPSPDGVVVKGRTFSRGRETNLTKNDVLIVEEDAFSEELLGKKALIVKSNVEFSHILALSQALKIPSIYATGNFELPDGEFGIQAYNVDGYIYKH